MSYSGFSATNYLESLIQSASPARLRLLLIEKAVGLCDLLSGQWQDSPESASWDGPSIQLADILTELLSGVSQGNTPVAKKVADLYVFLIQHQNKAVEAGDATMIAEIRKVLDTEAETWRMVCAQSASVNENRSTTPASKSIAPMDRPITAGCLRPEDRASLAGSLNLQG
jgi:flagellar protein FliS